MIGGGDTIGSGVGFEVCGLGGFARVVAVGDCGVVVW